MKKLDIKLKNIEFNIEFETYNDILNFITEFLKKNEIVCIKGENDDN